jgi:hypothetical protein
MSKIFLSKLSEFTFFQIRGNFTNISPPFKKVYLENSTFQTLI